jgi:hypothetical protein
VVRFWDSSALLSLVLKQAVTEELSAMLFEDNRLVVWWGTRVEGVSAICRLLRSGEADQSVALQLFDEFDAITALAREIEPTEEVRATALRMLRVHELRAADALQLAAASVWAGQYPTGFGFVSLDRRLRQAAAREGFEVWPRPPQMG